jgi:glycosyltransferase involved in cell wall biosynthesis
MNIVLAHDSITQIGGAERVAFALHEMYPYAPFFILALDKRLGYLVSGWDVRPSKLQPIFNVYPKFQHLLALIPWAVDHIDIPNCTVVVSSSSFFIKGIKKPKASVHINYCHTPTRFLWIDHEYVKQEVPVLVRPLVRLLFKHLRNWDIRAAKRVDYFIANSKEVQKRIKEIYNRESEIIYPFIDETFWKQSQAKSN